MVEPTHVIQEVLNDDFMSRSSRLHQGGEARGRLPVEEVKVVTLWCEVLPLGRRGGSLDVGVGVVIQQEADHLLVAGAGAVEQSGPASRVLQLQLSALLWVQKHEPLTPLNNNTFK